MKRIITLLIIMLAMFTSNAQKNKLPHFSVFEIPFYNLIGNGIFYDILYGDESPSFGSESYSQDYIFVITTKFNGPSSNLLLYKSNFQNDNINNIIYTKNQDLKDTCKYFFDNKGRVHSFPSWNCKYLDYTCVYSKKNVKIFDNKTCVGEYLFKGNNLVYKKLVYDEKMSECNIGEYYIQYNKDNYPKMIISKSKCKIDTIKFEYVFENDIIKIIRNNNLSKEIFYYDWNFRLIRCEFFHNSTRDKKELYYKFEYINEHISKIFVNENYFVGNDLKVTSKATQNYFYNDNNELQKILISNTFEKYDLDVFLSGIIYNSLLQDFESLIEFKYFPNSISIFSKHYNKNIGSPILPDNEIVIWKIID